MSASSTAADNQGKRSSEEPDERNFDKLAAKRKRKDRDDYKDDASDLSSSSDSSEDSRSRKRRKMKHRKSDDRKKRKHKHKKKKHKKHKKHQRRPSSSSDDEPVKRSVITGKKIKMHIKKTEDDLKQEEARRNLLRFMNSSLP